MKTDGLFSAHSVTINAKLNEPFYIIPFGDIHRESEAFAHEEWEQFLAYAKKKKNTYFFGMGDFCMPMDAEVLTAEGWKGFGSIRAGDLVYSHNKKTNVGEFTTVNYVYFTGDKKMITLKSKSFHVKVTPNHNWVCEQKSIMSKLHKNIATKDLKTQHKIKVAVKAKDNDDWIYSPLSTSDAVKIGWIVTEGHQRKNAKYAVNVSQSLGSKYLDEIENAFKGMITNRYFDNASTSYTYNFSRSSVKELFDRIGYSSKNDLPKIAASLPLAQAEAMFTAMLHGDGWKDTHNWRFSQKKGPVLDSFQILSAKLGIRIGAPVFDEESGVATISLMESRPLVSVADLVITESISTESAWCINTDNSSFVMRWNGQVTLTGNCDGCSTSERQILANAGMHDSTKATMKGVYRGVVKTLANELSFMKGKIIGMLGGNHFYELENGENTDHVLAHSLGAKYLGCTALVRLNIKLENRKATHLDIFANHGKGGGRTVGAVFNAIEDMQKVADADIYVMGHTHSKGTMPSFPRMRLVPNEKSGVTVRARQPFLGRTGSFLKTYENGKKAYGVDALYPGCSLGVIEFEVTPIRVCKDGVDRIELKITGKA